MSYEQTSLGVGGGIWASGIMMGVTTYITMKNIISQKKNYQYKEAQKILILLVTSPMLVGLSSWLVLIIGKDVGILEFLGDIIRAIGIIFFNAYAFRIFGWTESADKFVFSWEKAEEILVQQGTIPHPCKCCCKGIPIDSQQAAKAYIKRVQISGFQYLVVISCLFFISLILYAATDDENLQYAYIDFDSAYLWVSFIKIISMAYAIYNMILFSNASGRFQDETGFEMSNKFRSVQFGFLLTQVQSLLLGLVASAGWIADNDIYDTDDITFFTVNLLICMEMSILAFVQYVVFPSRDYNAIPKNLKYIEALNQ